MRLNMLLVVIYLVLSGCASTNATFHGGAPKSQIYGNYKINIYPDGFKTFGQIGYDEDKKDIWEITIKSDQMTDRQIMHAYRVALLDIEGQEIPTQFGLFLGLSQDGSSDVCVMGHDFPGTKAIVRVSTNKPVTTDTKGCTELTPDLDSQFKNSSKVLIRGRMWPNGYDTTLEVNIDGYEELMRYLNSQRSNER